MQVADECEVFSMLDGDALERVVRKHQPDIIDLGAIGRYDGTQNIWERGGEKRKAINR